MTDKQQQQVQEAIDADRSTILDFPHLLQVAEQRAEEFASAQPFKHIVIDDFLGADALDRILSVFPSPDPERTTVRWRNMDANTKDGLPAQRGKLDFSTRESGGKDLSNEFYVAPPIRQLFWELNSSTFLRFLEKLTGIPHLLPDPHMQGGGIHQIRRGGLLRVHADFNKHPIFGLDRRLNFLLYLNRDWKDEYEGHLELWSKDMKRCERRIAPIAGRAVVFTTLTDSYHGHPRALNCPEDMTRKSIAMYYYTNGRPEEEQHPPHATLWQRLPEEEEAPRPVE